MFRRIIKKIRNEPIAKQTPELEYYSPVSDNIAQAESQRIVIFCADKDIIKALDGFNKVSVLSSLFGMEWIFESLKEYYQNNFQKTDIILFLNSASGESMRIEFDKQDNRLMTFLAAFMNRAGIGLSFGEFHTTSIPSSLSEKTLLQVSIPQDFEAKETTNLLVNILLTYLEKRPDFYIFDKKLYLQEQWEKNVRTIAANLVSHFSKQAIQISPAGTERIVNSILQKTNLDHKKEIEAIVQDVLHDARIEIKKTGGRT